MEYFKASEHSWRGHIKKVEIERETESSVFIKDHRGKERRNAKINSYERYFDSFDGAKNWLIENAIEDIERARENVRDAEKTLHKYQELKEL